MSKKKGDTHLATSVLWSKEKQLLFSLSVMTSIICKAFSTSWLNKILFFQQELKDL